MMKILGSGEKHKMLSTYLNVDLSVLDILAQLIGFVSLWNYVLMDRLSAYVTME